MKLLILNTSFLKYGLAAVHSSGRAMECHVLMSRVSNKWQRLTSLFVMCPCFVSLAHARDLAFSCCAKQSIYCVPPSPSAPLRYAFHFVASFHVTASQRLLARFLNFVLIMERWLVKEDSRDLAMSFCSRTEK
jgi:hypothetical protein